MKKILLLLTLYFLTLGLVACSQSQPNSTETTSQSTDTSNNSTETTTSSTTKDSTTPNSTTVATNADIRQVSGKQVLLTIGDQSFTVDLYDNPTADDLYNQIPLTLTINDYTGWDEKIIRLDKKLSMEDAPDGEEPFYPEVGYYEPGNWIALYYGEIGYWSGKVPLGIINATTTELANLPTGKTVTIEKIDINTKQIIYKRKYSVQIPNTSF